MRFLLLPARLQPDTGNARSLLASTAPGTRISPTLRHPLLPPQAAEPVKGAREIRRRRARQRLAISAVASFYIDQISPFTAKKLTQVGGYVGRVAQLADAQQGALARGSDLLDTINALRRFKAELRASCIETQRGYREALQKQVNRRLRRIELTAGAIGCGSRGSH